MAYETLDFHIRPEDGWVEVASNYASLLIRPSEYRPWRLAITDGTAPDKNLIGLTFGRGADNAREVYQSAGANTGKAFIRIMQPSASYPKAKTHFGVIIEAAA